MCIYSDSKLAAERRALAPYAIHSDHVWYASRSPKDTPGEPLDPHGSRSRYRTPFEIDADRITNSQAFRRLEYKTQVFVTHEGDNYRTRLTHTLEVAEIARHIASALRLNINLVEAIALGHDLGHAPYGHVAENAINEWIRDLDPPLGANYYFCHNRHSIENVDHLEPGYDWDNRDPDDPEERFAQGLNLTRAVREGILVHTCHGYRGQSHLGAVFDADSEIAIRQLSRANTIKGLFFPGTLEAQVVRLADDLAQRMHDIEDGLRSGVLKKHHIAEELRGYFDDLSKTMFVESSITSGDHLIHAEHGTAVCKYMLDQIVNRKVTGFTMYQQENPANAAAINHELKNKADNRQRFLRAAIVAFLLHMWRDDRSMDAQDKGDQTISRSRILKYYGIVSGILGDPDFAPGNGEAVPAYHYIAFLRGAMLASAIEHAYREIHYALDPQFRSFRDGATKKWLQNDESVKCDNRWHVVFVVIDGFTTAKDGKQGVFEAPKKGKSRYCFTFDSVEAKNEFLKTHLRHILSGNGAHLKQLVDIREPVEWVERVNWLNKSVDSRATEVVRIIMADSGMTEPGCVARDSRCRWVPIERVEVYFTGYAELCPGLGLATCATGSGKNCDESKGDCLFRSNRTRYPDIRRLIDFQAGTRDLDERLKKLIRERIHRSSAVARMNRMGKKVIKELLEAYLRNPRIMHDRVWTSLRIYPDKSNVSPAVAMWVKKTVGEKERERFPEDALKKLTSREASDVANCDRYSLVRRVVEHVAGMTDRYIAKEYNRITQCGREAESQDETYFFS